MPAWLESNSSGGGEVALDVVVERDDGIFLGVSVTDGADREIGEWVTNEDRHIEEFFDMVAEARKDWERLKAEP